MRFFQTILKSAFHVKKQELNAAFCFTSASSCGVEVGCVGYELNGNLSDQQKEIFG